ncbi:DUF3800 domain-containing protein [Patescibacteria group bacterium]|nr:DUF3800 domain-containing protein [Patescibacteria group bacterium]MCG2695112.1 DUF3800 domain-containing protein [Candidatus Parcubacteria bacterium]
MTHIFLDESGDLGFKKRSSKWFLFTVVVIDNKRKLEKIIKKVRKTLKKKYKNVNELHSYHCDEITRKRVLKKLAELENLKIFCVVLNKQKVYVDLQNQKNYLYNYTANILLDRLHNKDIIPTDKHINICIDRKDTKKKIRENFESYLGEELKNRRNGDFEIVLKGSHEEKSLQTVDFISWAIFRKYEQGDYSYYEIIKDKIVGENLLFP